MSIKITAYTTSKRRNSTLIPTDGTEFHAAFKNPTSVINPVLTVNADSFPYTEISFTIAGVTRYYFVEDVISVNNALWDVRCSCDVLATWKSQIVGANAFILYSTSGYSSGLVDSRLPVVYQKTYSGESFQVLDSIYNVDGFYIVSVVGEGSGIHNFKINPSDMVALMARIEEYQSQYDVDWPEPGEDFLEYIGAVLNTIGTTIVNFFKQIGSFGNALSNIRACTWIPFNPPSAGTAEVVLGGYHTGFTANYINGKAYREDTNVNIPWQYTDWRNGVKNTDMHIMLPWAGVLSLPVSQIEGDTSISVRASLSPLTGDIGYEIWSSTTKIAAIGAATGCAVPLGTSNINPIKSANAILSGVGSALTGNTLSGIASVAASASAAVTPISTTIGGIGNASAGGFVNYGYLETTCHNTSEAPTTGLNIHGSPSFKTMPIPASGFIQTQDFQVAAPCLELEAEQVNRLCNTGIYVE